MVEAYTGIGSNLGHKEENIRKAIGFMRKKCKILKVSSLYKTEPLGYKEQGWFLNCAIEVETGLKPDDLLKFLLWIEKRLGRVRTIKNGPRTIDLDILFYGEKIINKNNLIVPHPRLHERLFVLEPLNEICQSLIHPVLKKSIKKLTPLAKIEGSQNYEKYLKHLQ